MCGLWSAYFTVHIRMYVFHGTPYPIYVLCMSSGPYTFQSLLSALRLISLISLSCYFMSCYSAFELPHVTMHAQLNYGPCAV